MFSKLMPFGRRSQPAQGAEGLVYVCQADQGPMQGATEGAVIRIPDRHPPWIVVNHDPGSVIVAKWPGRLWRVQIVDAATPMDQRAFGGAPLPHARYTRAVAVKVVREEDASQLFGPGGKAILPVLDAASNLVRSRAELLASARHADAADACDRLWRAWMQEQGVPSDAFPKSLDGVLLLSTYGSPINDGLSVLHSVVFDRAKELDGDAATISDDEDIWLAPPWDAASTALTDAALALGAPSWANSADREILTQAWKTVYA
ncbi:hypothetical protein [Phenylobacterium aquaticum]|uniref:hypothetical protein n=1 Tax=Phenylobacterium aquaticum TaxID=1763816 RepID=UPI0026EB2EDB|nr:hypothetical protein [Phenylobacterium aquaticum]